MRKLLILAILSILAVSCNKKTKFDNVPKLTFKELNMNTVQAGSDNRILIHFYFEDGDGNIGFGTPNLFIKDSRDTSANALVPYNIPDIPDKFNPESGLSGLMQIEYEAAFLLLRPDPSHQDFDTLTWDIYMKDKAGNISNTITTSPLILTK